MNIEKYRELIGFEGTVLELSNKLVALGCEDICEFGNWDDILVSNSVIVAVDLCGEEHVEVFFDVLHYNGSDESVVATEILVDRIEEY